jgi:hypothetical protein
LSFDYFNQNHGCTSHDPFTMKYCGFTFAST